MLANQQIVFIDSQVADYQLLANGVLPGIEVVILKSDRTAKPHNDDGISQITEALNQGNNYTSIHIVSHGSPGCIYLGNTQLSLDTLNKYQSQLKTWFSSSPSPQVPKSPSLLIYSCNVAAGDAGEEFISKLHNITGAKIAASTTPIGNADLGGNWELDSQTSAIKTPTVFRKTTQQNYAEIFGTYQNTDAQTIATASTITKQFNVTENVSITDVSLDLFTQHSWRGNTQTVLTSPNGTTVTLISRDQSDNWNHFEISLEDGSTNLINDGDDDGTDETVDRTAKPSNPFSAFDGESALGTWTLGITNFEDTGIPTPTTRELTFTSSQLNITGNPQISGTVYRDYDLDGSQAAATSGASGVAGGEPGIRGVTVTAYDTSGNSYTTTTDSDGNYTFDLATTGTGDFRLEFDLPTGFAAGGDGTGDGSLVQFVNNSSGANVDLALNRPEQYYSATDQAAPFVVIPCFVYGDQETGTYNTDHVLVTFAYDGSTTDSSPIYIADANEIGTVYGIAFDRSRQDIYTSAYTKRHAGYAEDGAGAIYKIGVNDLNVTSNADFNTPELLSRFK